MPTFQLTYILPLFVLPVPSMALSGSIASTVETKRTTITWYPPSFLDRNGLITMYRITVRNTRQYGVSTQHDQTTQDLSESPNDQNSALTKIIEGLEEDYLYVIDIQACTSVGCSTHTSSINITTLEAGKPSSQSWKMAFSKLSGKIVSVLAMLVCRVPTTSHFKHSFLNHPNT